MDKTSDTVAGVPGSNPEAGKLLKYKIKVVGHPNFTMIGHAK